MEKRCLECGGKFAGRADAKFCSDQCRSTHNNKSGGYADAYVRKVNGILRKNRKILKDLNPDDKARVKETDLVRLGFDFGYCTNTYTTKAGKTYIFCYDKGFLSTGDGWVTLVTKHDYVA